jgi:hypothetical protein
MANRALKKTAKVLGGLGAAYALSKLPVGEGVEPGDVNQADAAKDAEETRQRIERNRVQPAARSAIHPGLLDDFDFDKGRREPFKKGGMARAKRFNDGGATSTYPFQSAGGAAPGSTTTVNVNGAPAATTAPADQMLTAPVQAMKKGGSVKGWGMARGARKAKVY